MEVLPVAGMLAAWSLMRRSLGQRSTNSVDHRRGCRCNPMSTALASTDSLAEAWGARARWTNERRPTAATGQGPPVDALHPTLDLRLAPGAHDRSRGRRLHLRR